MPRVIVDTTALYQTLLGGAARRVFFECSDDVEFITSSYTISEICGKIGEIAEQTGSTEEELLTILAVLPIQVLGEKYYSLTLDRAQRVLANRDPNDVPLLALYYAIDGDCIWTNDPDFEDAPNAATNTTGEMLSSIEESVSGRMRLFEDSSSNSEAPTPSA